MSKEIKKSRIPKLRFPEFRDAGEWEEVKLRDLGTFRGGVTSIKKEDYGFGTPFITYMNVFRNSKVSLDDLTLMNIPEKDLKRFECKYGDILFTASSETEDEVAMSSVLLKEIKDLTFNGFSKRFRLNNFETLTPIFARYLLRSNNFRNSVRRLVTGNIRFNIGQENLENIQVVLPSPPEQKAIADCLSSVDELITAQTQKIDALKAHKKGLMQKLFPAEGKTLPKLRFPQFQDTGEWDIDEIKNVCLITTGDKNTQDRKDSGRYPFFIRSQQIEKIDTYSFDGEAVLTAGDGGVGKIFHYINGKFAFHQRVYKMSNFSNRVNGFYFYKYFSHHFYSRVMSMSAKTTVDSVRMEMISDMQILLPGIKEQKAIADCLSSVDELITAQTQKTDALKAHKKGLMQKLFPSHDEVNR